MKIALISGITGQSGSYLAEFLLKKNYNVHGIIRRSSSFNTARLDKIYQDPHIPDHHLHLHYGDVTDTLSIDGIMKEVNPDEIYHLGAQSHVRVSFDVPGYTAQTDAFGTLNMLEAMRKHCPQAKFYNAATSELYGKVLETPQKETTPFNPQSPYGAAKLYAYTITKIYREAYNLFAVNGILFNHETLTEDSPLIFKQNNEIDIKPISEIVINHTNEISAINKNIKKYQECTVSKDLKIWDKNGWVKVTFASGYPHDIENNFKDPKTIISKNAAYSGTGSHKCIMEDISEKSFESIKIGDKVSLLEKFEYNCIYENISKKEAKLLGFIIGDGSIDYRKKIIRLTNQSHDLLNYYTGIWEKLGYKIGKRTQASSGFKEGSFSNQQYLQQGNKFLEKYPDFYDSYKNKRIPKKILNSSSEIQLEFLRGYQDADGLKSHKNTYEFRTFKTNSSTLAQGLIYLIKNTTDQNFNINVERSFRFEKYRTYYTINLLSNNLNVGKNREKDIENIKKLNYLKYSQRKISRELNLNRGFVKSILSNSYIPNKKHHLSIKENSVKKIIDIKDYNGWFFDLSTESGTFHAGIGLGYVHNSERRGSTFVTAKIVNGLYDYLKNGTPFYLGNVYAKRDWGYAPEYVECMWRMLQQEKPEDFVIGTGETHTIKEFVNECLDNMEWDGVCQYVWSKDKEKREILIDTIHNKIVIGIDEKYYRPTEVDLLLADASKAKEKLGWEPKVTFKELVKIMMKYRLYIGKI